MFSKACEYGLRALIVIAKESEADHKMGITEVCKLAGTPKSFTAKVLQDLVRHGILHSQKGPSGGFYFNRDINKLKIYEIVSAIDGTQLFEKCGLGLSECDASKPCPMHDEFAKVRGELELMCKNNTLASLLENAATPLFRT